MPAAIVDTGPLIALLERYHGWATERIGDLDVPLLTCEPVLVEAMHLLARQDALFGLLENGALGFARSFLE
jgi:hypothetical protein